MLKANIKTKQLEMDFVYVHTQIFVPKTLELNKIEINEIRMNSRKIFQKNYIKEKKRKELISYILNNEKSF
ncbi:hypothetical protein ACN9J6_09730 [Aliarcobacter butzleri]|uniref:hypothetical protein n=1 Tax=Aliarcobacter butzleri TaxID=28197 RepID=UPI003B224750